MWAWGGRGGYMPKQEPRKLGDTIFKTTTSRSPPLKRKVLWTLKTRRSGLRRRPGTLRHWGLHQSCCCVTVMDVVTHSLFGFCARKRNQDSPTDLMNYPERSEQTRTWEQLKSRTSRGLMKEAKQYGLTGFLWWIVCYRAFVMMWCIIVSLDASSERIAESPQRKETRRETNIKTQRNRKKERFPLKVILGKCS